MSQNGSVITQVPQWGRFEWALDSTAAYPNPIQDAALRVVFSAPSGRQYAVQGFWDGGTTWRVRFMPGELGVWRYTTTCSDPANAGLHNRSGQFECVASNGLTRFDQHGPVRLSDNRRFLVHADGTPFFWLADTAWAGPLRATAAEWDHYITTRVRQRFTVVQWMASQTLAVPGGDREHGPVFSGYDRIAVNPAAFQRLDAALDALNCAGLLGMPVLLWAAEWSTPYVNYLNPGYLLPEDQLILLARYMIARWGAHHVVWALGGDAPYLGSKAERWCRIGSAVFGDGPHAPVIMHPCGMQLPSEEFKNEGWLDLMGYQSGHGDDDPTLLWLLNGPPATEWRKGPTRPFINLEPPYEDHVAYQSQRRFDAFAVRRALYWSLLVAPTAGVSYGGHGVWGWDDGTVTPWNHPTTGIPRPWQDALLLPVAEQYVPHLAGFFASFAWWTLRPAPEMLIVQPGTEAPRRFITAARSDEGDLAVFYIPEDRTIMLNLEQLKPGLAGWWGNPRTGERIALSEVQTPLTTPGEGDWLLVLAAPGQ